MVFIPNINIAFCGSILPVNETSHIYTGKRRVTITKQNNIRRVLSDRKQVTIRTSARGAGVLGGRADLLYVARAQANRHRVASSKGRGGVLWALTCGSYSLGRKALLDYSGVSFFSENSLALNIRPCCDLRHGFSAGLIFGVYQLCIERRGASNERNRRKR